jgi:hypothetical protein
MESFGGSASVAKFAINDHGLLEVISSLAESM